MAYFEVPRYCPMVKTICKALAGAQNDPSNYKWRKKNDTKCATCLLFSSKSPTKQLILNCAILSISLG